MKDKLRSAGDLFVVLAIRMNLYKETKSGLGKQEVGEGHSTV